MCGALNAGMVDRRTTGSHRTGPLPARLADAPSGPRAGRRRAAAPQGLRPGRPRAPRSRMTRSAQRKVRWLAGWCGWCGWYSSSTAVILTLVALKHTTSARHLNPVGNSSVGSRLSLVAARLRNAQPATDPVSETVGEFGIARHSLNRSSGRVEPQRVSSAFPLQDAAVSAQMPQQAAALHAARTSTTIVSRSASSGTPRSPSSRRSRSSRAMAC